jgi:hypothetical protein
MSRISQLTVALTVALAAASCIGADGGSVWDAEESLPRAESESLVVESTRPDNANATVDVPILAAPIGGVYVAADGSLVTTRVESGALVTTRTAVDLPTPDGQKALVLARPARIADGEVAVAYNLIDEQSPLDVDAEVRGHRLAVYDLEAGALDSDYSVVALSAEGSIRADLVAAVGPRVDVERIFVGYGATAAPGGVIAVDPNAWRAGGEAVVGEFATTTGAPGACAETSTRDDAECGGGVHGQAAIGLLEGADASYDVLVATGKGATDVTRGDFANGVLRLDSDLQYDPACDADICAAEGGSSDACLRSCENFFVPRPVEREAEPVASFGAGCDAGAVLDCSSAAAFDGSSAPVVVASGGDTVLVWAAPDGYLYAMPASNWSAADVRVRVADAYGDAMSEAVDAHTPMTTPVADGGAVLLPTYSAGNAPAGIARYAVQAGDATTIARTWSAPPLDHPSATERFRERPSRLAGGAIVETGALPRLFAPRQFGSERGIDVFIRGDGAVSATSAPIFERAGTTQTVAGHVNGDGAAFDAVVVETTRPYAPSKGDQ